MKIKEIELTPPSKEAMKLFKKFMCEHDKGLKAIKTLEEIKSLCFQQDLESDFFACEILQKINEVENGRT
jgi:hypothetical protein